jgi:hypothetical protein
MNRANKGLFACNVAVLLAIICLGAAGQAEDKKTDDGMVKAKTLIIGDGDKAVIIEDGAIHATGITLDNKLSPARVELGAFHGVAGIWVGQKDKQGRRYVGMTVSSHDGPAFNMMSGKPGLNADDFAIMFDGKETPVIKLNDGVGDARLLAVDRFATDRVVHASTMSDGDSRK